MHSHVAGGHDPRERSTPAPSPSRWWLLPTVLAAAIGALVLPTLRDTTEAARFHIRAARHPGYHGQVRHGISPNHVTPADHFQRADDMTHPPRTPTTTLSAGLFDALGFGVKDTTPRGVTIPGWQGNPVLIPNGIPTSPVTNALKLYTFPNNWPYGPRSFARMDESDDARFYDAPRFVTHIDDGAIAAIRTFYGALFAQAPQGEYSVLDTCSSWVSHYPTDLNAKRVAITGMNEAELKRNRQATDYTLKDLNKDPTLPFEDGTFDFVTNVVSIDYLTKPRQIVTELHRVTKPGGVAIFSFSNRCFFTKAIAIWIADMNDGPGHCRIVADYFRFSPDGGWKDIRCVDISANPGRSDPMWVVTAVKV